MKNNNTLLIIAILVIIASAGYIYLSGGTFVRKENIIAPTEEMVGEESAESGEQLTAEEEEVLKAEIKQAVAEKNDINPEELKITVREVEGDYATGGAGSVTPGPGGGVWFAAKVNEQWELVWDGNGSIYCFDLRDYPNFPTSLIAECYDEGMGEMVPR